MEKNQLQLRPTVLLLSYALVGDTVTTKMMMTKRRKPRLNTVVVSRLLELYLSWPRVEARGFTSLPCCTSCL